MNPFTDPCSITRSEGIDAKAGRISSAWKNLGVLPEPEAFALCSSRSLDGGLYDIAVAGRSLLILGDRTVRPVLNLLVSRLVNSIGLSNSLS